MSRATISTHVLDVALGKPASGVPVTLTPCPTQVTDLDGRIPDLTSGGIEPGSYQIVYDLRGYFGTRPHLINRVALDLEVAEARHYHVPLLISPYSCSSYQGT